MSDIIKNSLITIYCIDDFKTRMFGNKIYVDIEIKVAGDDSLQHAHLIAHKKNKPMIIITIFYYKKCNQSFLYNILPFL